VKVKNIDDVVSVNMFVWDTKFIKWETNDNDYIFIVPSDLKITPLNKHIYFKVKLKWWKEQEYFYDKFFPEFNGIDLSDLIWWEQVKIYWDLIWSCKLFYDDGKNWSLSYNADKWYLLTIPKKIEKEINWGYIKCDGLSSNYKKFHIPASPKLLYLMSKDKKQIVPGSKVVLRWQNIRLNKDDDIKLLLNWKETDYDFVDDNTLEFKLPYENLNEAKIKIIRNGFESNEIKFSANTYFYIKSVSAISRNNQKYFRLYGDFDFDLWDVKVYFWSKELKILNTWHKYNQDYINVWYPIITIDDENNFWCSYYLEPNYFYIKIWWKQSSNKYFYTPDSDLYITYIEKPFCDNEKCYIKVYTSKELNKAKVLVSGRRKDYYSLANLLKIETDDLIRKWDIQIITRNCIKSPKYYFNFEDDFKPLIKYIESSDHFKSQSDFTIYWDNFAFTSPKSIDTKVSFNPDIVEDIRRSNTIKGTIKYWTENDTKVKVNVSTRYWNSNWASFVIWWKWKYYWNPIIKNVLYLDGWEGWQQAVINWIGFSENCNEDKIYFAWKVLYPTNCSYSQLTFEIPEDRQTDKIAVEVNDNKSSDYKLNTKIGWTIIDKTFKVYNFPSTKLVNLEKDKLDQEISFNIKNTLTDIYLSSLKFVISGADVLPAGNFVLEVNWNDKKFSWSYVQHKVLQTSEKNIWYVKKTKNWYEITFKWIYIPFSTDDVKAKLKFTFSKWLKNGSLISFVLPKQKIYYNNIFWEQKVSRANLDKSYSVVYKILNTENICFDADSTYKNCALVLQWWEVNFHNEKISKPKQELNQNTKTTSKAQNKKTTTKQSQNMKTILKPQNKKVLTKQEKIANRLTVSKMKLVNKLLKQFIVKIKNKYKNNKAKLKYIVEMYRWYKQMVKNTQDDFDKKVEYVNWLIYFAKNYFVFIKIK